jgi:hypothetical protein
VLFLIMSFLEVTKALYSHQARSQRGSCGRQQVIVEVRKMELSSGDEYIAKTRQEGRQRSETSAFTSQSEISRIGALSFLWCLFIVGLAKQAMWPAKTAGQRRIYTLYRSFAATTPEHSGRLPHEELRSHRRLRA